MMDFGVQDPNDVDDSICPVCRGSTYVGETISCETCHYWFHFECVGVTHTDKYVIREDVPYYCPSCCRHKKLLEPSQKSQERCTKASTKNSRKRKSQSFKETGDVDISTTPVKSKAGSSQVLSSPPIKLKITLGTKNKKSASATGPHLPSAKCDTSFSIQSNSILKSRSNRKSVKSTIQASNKIEVSASDHKIKDTYTPVTSTYTQLQPAQSSCIENENNQTTDSNDSECDEEEKWLNAVESGNYGSLDKIDSELKNIKDPKLMTARQRAMAAATGSRCSTTNSGESTPYEVGNISRDESETEIDESFRYDGGHIALDYGTGLATFTNQRGCPIQQPQKQIDEEILIKKAAKSAERRKVELEKREVSKQKTMDRLLKKKDSKINQLIPTTKTSARNKFGCYPQITYRISSDGQRTLSLAHGIEYPIKKSGLVSPVSHKVKRCHVCKLNPKKYTCSKTHKPLCSLECYKTNLSKLSDGIFPPTTSVT